MINHMYMCILLYMYISCIMYPDQHPHVQLRSVRLLNISCHRFIPVVGNPMPKTYHLGMVYTIHCWVILGMVCCWLYRKLLHVSPFKSQMLYVFHLKIHTKNMNFKRNLTMQILHRLTFGYGSKLLILQMVSN